MDMSTSSTVAQNTIITCAISAFVTGLYGIFTKNVRYGRLAGDSAINSGITAATFFTLREYVVSPGLISTLPRIRYSRRRNDLGSEQQFDNDVSLPLSWSDLRCRKLLDSGISGAATGGILRGLKSGPRAILPGAATAAVACGLLQLAFNELTVIRVKYVSQSDSKPSLEPAIPFLKRVLAGLGLREVSDEEYLIKMKKRRDIYLQRIQILERQIDEERTRMECNSGDNN